MITAVPTLDLPLAAPGSTGPAERADAARNRERILAAAARLVGERGIHRVSMQDVAEAAQVGTGTLYRRFGDRAGLALALLDEHTRAFQQALLAGPPPLGPGAPPVERLLAFGDGYLELLDRHAELIEAGTPSGREGPEPYALYATHLAVLLREAAPHLDAEYTARALMAALDPGLHLALRRGAAWELDRIKAGWRAAAQALSASGPAARGTASPTAAPGAAAGRSTAA